MKLNRMLVMCGMAALCLSAATLMAQDTGGNGGQGGRRQRGNGGGGPGGGNFDPAQFQQRIMDNIKEQLGFTNDTDWNAVQPLVQKVVDARRDVGMGGARMGRGNRGQGGQAGQAGPGGGRFGATPSPEEEALQKAIDDNAPSAQIKDLLAKYRAARKDKQARLEAAQNDLRKVLTVRQEAAATLLQLVP
jgi:hypothetical protein